MYNNSTYQLGFDTPVSLFKNNNTGNSSTYTYTNVTSSICELNTFHHADFTQVQPVSAIFVFLYIATALTALLGNCLVIVTVWINAKMHSKTNYYIVNLAISDFCVALLVLPMKLVEYTAPCVWQVYSSDMMCSAVRYLQPIFVFASILTLMAISIER